MVYLKMTNKNMIWTIMILLFGILLISSINIANATSDFVNLNEYDIEYTYDKAVSGERFTLTVKITNQDNENKENVRFEFDEKNPFEFVGDNDWNIGNLNAGESAAKNFRIEIDEDADSDDYEIEFELKDSKEDYDDLFEIKVISDKAKLAIGNLQSDPTTILPDMKDIQLTVEIENSGDHDARYVKAKLQLPQGFVPSSSYSDIANLGTIKAGETKEAIFYIDTEKTLNSNLYDADIELNYENDKDEYSEKLEIDLPVQGIPQFSISSITTNPSKIMQKDSVIMKIEIKNIGKKQGKDTSIKVFEKSDQPFEFKEKTNYIGSLESGSIGTAILKFDVDKNAVPTNYLLNFQIRTVYNGNVIISEETIPITISEYKRSQVDYLKIAGLFLGGIFAILIILLFVSKRKKSIKKT